MTQEQAKNNIQACLDGCAKAGMLQDIKTAATISESWELIKKELDEVQSLRDLRTALADAAYQVE